MKIQIQKVIVALDLGEYAPEYKGQNVDVWINPTKNVLNTLDDLNTRSREEMDKMRAALPKDDKADRTTYTKVLEAAEKWHTEVYAPSLHKWYGDLWSKSEDKERHWTLEELILLDEQDPALYGWLRERSQALIKEHRDKAKKA